MKRLDNSNPQLALTSYDSLGDDITKASTYVRNKYTLLGIHLRDIRQTHASGVSFPILRKKEPSGKSRRCTITQEVCTVI